MQLKNFVMIQLVIRRKSVDSFVRVPKRLMIKSPTPFTSSSPCPHPQHFVHRCVNFFSFLAGFFLAWCGESLVCVVPTSNFCFFFFSFFFVRWIWVPLSIFLKYTSIHLSFSLIYHETSWRWTIFTSFMSISWWWCSRGLFDCNMLVNKAHLDPSSYIACCQWHGSWCMWFKRLWNPTLHCAIIISSSKQTCSNVTQFFCLLSYQLFFFLLSFWGTYTVAL